MTVKLSEQAFDPWRELQDYQSGNGHLKGLFGATGVFVGTMRDFNAGDEVDAMMLEHYPGMTEKQLEKITDQAAGRWSLLETLLVHRVGEIVPHDPIVLVAVWSSHRGDALDACRYIIEALKSRAPFWKKERLRSGETRWVEKNTGGYLSSS